MIRNIRLRQILYLLPFLLGACNTDVELCYDEHPHRTLLDFQFAWGEEYASLHPDSMHVIAVRLSNSIRYDYRVSAQQSGNSGSLLYPDSEKEVVEGEHNGLDSTKLWARTGTYQFVAFSNNEDLFTSSENQGSNDLHSPSNLTFSYREYSLKQILEQLPIKVWSNHNTYSSYITNIGMPIFFATIDALDVPIYKGADVQKLLPVQFTPKPITQNLVFDFEIQRGDGVYVDSVWAEISGVPSGVNVTNTVLRTDTTYKMLFPVEVKREETPSSSGSGTFIGQKCEGRISALGLVPPAFSSLTTGPGILHLAVYTHAFTSDGVKKGRIFRVCINLLNTLKKYPSITWVPDLESYKQIRFADDRHILIASPLRIEKDRIVSNEDEDILDDWEELEQIDLDI